MVFLLQTLRYTSNEIRIFCEIIFYSILVQVLHRNFIILQVIRQMAIIISKTSPIQLEDRFTLTGQNVWAWKQRFCLFLLRDVLHAGGETI